MTNCIKGVYCITVPEAEPGGKFQRILEETVSIGPRAVNELLTGSGYGKK